MVRYDGETEIDVDGTRRRLATTFSPDFGMPVHAPIERLQALPDRSVLEERRARLLAPVEPIPRDLAAREREIGLAMRGQDVDAGIECLRNLRASRAKVKNAYECALFKQLLPMVVTPIAIGLGEEPVELANLAGIESSPRLGPLYK